jgi:hypothetical protein
MEQLYSVNEACRILGGISKWTLYSWFTRGLAVRSKVGRRTMISESELRRLVVSAHK